jgi:hypothetical protein
MIEAVAWAGGITGTSFAIASVIKSFWGNKYCSSHKEMSEVVNEWREFSKKLTYVLSDTASIKQAVIDLSVFICDKGQNGEGRKLRDEIISAMMKHRKVE